MVASDLPYKIQPKRQSGSLVRVIDTRNLFPQMSAESVRYEFIRLHEWPFSSELKYMTVKVTPRRNQVGVHYCDVVPFSGPRLIAYVLI